MTDVSEILAGAGVTTKNNKGNSTPTSRPGSSLSAPSSKKKLTSAQREVLSLLESKLATPTTEVLPTLAPGTHGGRKFVVNPNVKTKSWRLVPFKNNARRDDLRLQHWQREDVSLDNPYAFERFNKSIYVAKWDSDEWYDQSIAPTSGDWTKEDTTLLFDLSKRFDCRWPVVWDRFNLIVEKGRDLTALKERFYTVSKLVVQSAPPNPPSGAPPASSSSSGSQTTTTTGASASPAADAMSLDRNSVIPPKLINEARSALRAYEFDVAQERERNRQLDNQFRVTKKDEAEEVQMIAALQKADGNLKTVLTEVKKDRTKKKSASHKKKVQEEPPPPPPPVNVALSSDDEDDYDLTMLDKAAIELNEQIEQIPVSSQYSDQPSTATMLRRPLGASLRSSRLDEAATPLGLGVRMTRKVKAFLHALGTIPSGDLDPTIPVCDAYDALRRDVVKLLVLQRALIQKKQELATATGTSTQRGRSSGSSSTKNSQSSSATAAAAAAAAATAPTAPAAATATKDSTTATATTTTTTTIAAAPPPPPTSSTPSRSVSRQAGESTLPRASPISTTPHGGNPPTKRARTSNNNSSSNNNNA